MGDWERSTRACTPEALPSEMSLAVRKHIEQYNLGSLLNEVLACVETTSKKAKSGMLGKGEENVVTGVIVTRGWLVWAIRGTSSEVAVMSAQLADIVVQDYAATEFAKMVPDAGIEVSGSFTDAAERGSAFIGLGEEPAALELRRVVIQAVQGSKK
jgi:hypothetical protein